MLTTTIATMGPPPAKRRRTFASGARGGRRAPAHTRGGALSLVANRFPETRAPLMRAGWDGLYEVIYGFVKVPRNPAAGRVPPVVARLMAAARRRMDNLPRELRQVCRALTLCPAFALSAQGGRPTWAPPRTTLEQRVVDLKATYLDLHEYLQRWTIKTTGRPRPYYRKLPLVIDAPDYRELRAHYDPDDDTWNITTARGDWTWSFARRHIS